MYLGIYWGDLIGIIMIDFNILKNRLLEAETMGRFRAHRGKHKVHRGSPILKNSVFFVKTFVMPKASVVSASKNWHIVGDVII
jgi:hypothetical protein